MNNIAKPIYRIISGFIDGLIFNLPFIYGVYSLSKASSIESIFENILFFIILLLMIAVLLPLVNSFMISTFGGTIGKLLTGTKIVNAKNKTLTFWEAFFRNHIAYTVSKMVFFLGFIWILIDKERRGWHDMMANTYVVFVNKSMVILGILVLVIASWFNFYLIKTTINNFVNNANVYSELLNINDLKGEL